MAPTQDTGNQLKEVEGSAGTRNADELEVDGYYTGDPAGITAELRGKAMGQPAGAEDSLQYNDGRFYLTTATKSNAIGHAHYSIQYLHAYQCESGNMLVPFGRMSI